MHERGLEKRRYSPLRKGVGAGAALILAGGALTNCGNESAQLADKPSSSTIESKGAVLREFLQNENGRGYIILKDKDAESLGVLPVTPSHELTLSEVKNLYINDVSDEYKKKRITQWVYPASYHNDAGKTSHYSFSATGEPATVIVPKGVKVREVSYVDGMKNDEEFRYLQEFDPAPTVKEQEEMREQKEKSLLGPTDETRVFFGVDFISLIPPLE